MRDIDIVLFGWMSAGFTPNRIVLGMALMAATWGGGAALLLLSWSA